MGNTKENIIETARKLFGKYGFNKTSVDDIAHQLHIAKGTIYHYFKSKVDILEEVISREEKLLRDELKRNIDAAETPQDKLRAFVITRFNFIKNLSNYYDALKEDYLSNHAFIERVRKSDLEKDLNIVSQILEEGKSKFVFNIHNVYFTASAILTAIHGLEYPLVINNQFRDFERSVDELLKILLKGIEA